MDTVQFVAVAFIRVNYKQANKVCHHKVSKHVRELETGTSDLHPIELHTIGDGTFIIAGNGRHRYFAYVSCGYSQIPAIVHQQPYQERPAPAGFLL
jgi:hypothetical protein